MTTMIFTLCPDCEDELIVGDVGICTNCCSHDEHDHGICLDCGKDNYENIAARAYDAAKDARYE